MPNPADALHLVLLAQKLLGENPLHPPVHVVQEHMGRPTPAPPPRHHRRRVDRRHPTGRLREEPPRTVDQDQIPFPLVHLPRHLAQRQGAPPVPLQRRSRRKAGWLRPVRAEELVGVGQAGAVLDGARVELWRDGEDGLDPLGVLLKEEGGAGRVEGGPHQRIAAEAEDEEVGRRLAAGQDAEGDLDLLRRLLRHLACGGVVEDGAEVDGRRQLVVAGGGGERWEVGKGVGGMEECGGQDDACGESGQPCGEDWPPGRQDPQSGDLFHSVPDWQCGDRRLLPLFTPIHQRLSLWLVGKGKGEMGGHFQEALNK